VTRFIDHLQIVTTSNYISIANLHTWQTTTAHAKSSQSAVTSRFPVTDLNNGDFSASVLTSLPTGIVRIYLTQFRELSLSLSIALQPFGPWPLFSFLVYTQSVGPLGRGSSRRKGATYFQNKRTKTSMPRVGLEPTIPVFERVKTVHALDRAAIAIGFERFYAVYYRVSDL
jgi:hypothetical protein